MTELEIQLAKADMCYREIAKYRPFKGEMLKEAARKSYEALQAKLTELSVKDVTIEVSE